MSVHTPGPWKVHSLPDGREFGHHVTTIGGLTICAVTYQLPASVDGAVVERARIDNARLIARAPDMQDALQEAESYFADRADVIDGDYGEPAPNEEMKMLGVVRSALGQMP